MKITRRNFLAAFSASLTALVPFTGNVRGADRLGSWLSPNRAPLSNDALSRLGWSSFYAYLNTDFDFATPQKRNRLAFNRLTLTDVSGDGQRRMGPLGQEPQDFVLTFTGSAAPVLGPRLLQNTYTVQHFALGTFDLFISDGSVVNGECVYTAVINRTTA